MLEPIKKLNFLQAEVIQRPTLKCNKHKKLKLDFTNKMLKIQAPLKKLTDIRKNITSARDFDMT